MQPLPKREEEEMEEEKPSRMEDDDITDLAGPSHGMAEGELQELEKAVSAIPPMEDPTFRDPLGDYCDQSSFNIIQFLAENDTPSVSPAPALRNMNNNNDAAAAASTAATRRPAQAGNSRLPDSPPITDVSAAGSSASPSSNSDSPYSPENYPNYSVLGHNGNTTGLILGVNELGHNPAMLDALTMIPPASMHSQRGANQQQQMPQAQNVYMHSPYSNAPHQQISPPDTNMRYMSYGESMNVFPDMIGSAGDVQMPPPSVDNQPGRKRPRQEPQPVFDRSRVKPDPLQMHYPNNAPSRFAPTPAAMASSPVGGESYMDENFHQTGEQVIKFARFMEETWATLYDERHNELRQLQVHVVADKGFNYSSTDNVFVNQKKNHFQISVNIEANDELPPVLLNAGGKLCAITQFKLSLCGVKSEMPTSEIQIKQSQTDRRPVPHDPLDLNMIPARQLTKVTVPRLHFSETTMNNQRKNNRPNPDQKYFLLLVRLTALTDDGVTHLVQAYASEKVIVRATNPGQFESPESDVAWMKAGHMLYTGGPVGIGTDRSTGAILNIHGDIHHVGSIHNPSDLRLKENITEIEAGDAVERLNKLRIVNYSYKKDIADQWGLSERSRNRAGVIAQELQKVIPEAVNDDGEFLTIDESRIFYDNVVATQEMSKLQKEMEEKMGGEVKVLQKTLGKMFKTPPSMLKKTDEDGEEGEACVSGEQHTSLLHQSLGLSGSRFSLTSAFKREIKTTVEPEIRDNLGCTTKLTQGTIVTLVFVMAVCLLSMSALYVLDWHHRNYGIHAIVRPTPMPIPEETTDGIGYMKSFISLPNHQPEAPPLHALCAHEHCQSYCCYNRHFYHLEEHFGGYDKNTVVPLMDDRTEFFATIAGSKELTPSAFVGKPFSTGVKFEMLNMNVSIDERYCVDNSCNFKHGRFIIYVPMSPYLPTNAMFMRVTPPEGKYVNNCGYVAELGDDACAPEGDPYKADRVRPPTLMQLTDDVYEITASAFKRSTYRFRIGYNVEACNESAFKSSYEEYVLVFYRACFDPPSPMTPSPMYDEAEE